MTTTLYVDHGIGETRAVVLDGKDTALSFFLDREDSVSAHTRWGDVVSGYIRDIEPKAGAVFIELFNGDEVVWQLRSAERARGLSVGSEHLFQVKSETRPGKRAVVVRAKDDVPDPPPPFERWRSACPAITAETVTIDDASAGSVIDEIQDELLAPDVVLEGGGRITIEPTQALVSVDVDSSGRLSKGSPRARALSINRVAAKAVARQLELRRLGGLAVLDCIGPIDAKAGEEIRAAFRQGWSSITERKADVLYPSRFGLMEMSLAWRYTPLASQLAGTSDRAATSAALRLLREIERVGRANASRNITAEISQSLSIWLTQSSLPWREQLTERIGPRFTLTVADDLDPVAFNVKEER